jgi:UDP-N-acetylmuramoylalanine--D-glutamate ligase
LLNGTGTKKVESLKSKVENREANNLKDAIRFALEQTKRGDVLLFSPAFASFGMFKNEFDRGDKFIKIIKYL